jgi:hypothetical protein
MLYIRKLVAFIFYHDVRRTDTRDPSPANLAVAQGVQQDDEPREMARMLWFDSNQRNLILELAQVRSRWDDWRFDPQHMKSQPIFAATVADLDDVPLPNLVERIGELVVLLPFLGADRVQEGVPHFRGELQRLAGLCLFEAVAHYVPIPRPEKSPYS